MSEKETKIDYSNKEILEAVTMIKLICMSTADCEKCIFQTDNAGEYGLRCGIRNNIPASWRIVQPKPYSPIVY